MKVFVKASLLALAALWAGAALAGAGGGQASHLEELALLLDLTDAQKPQVESILQGAHAQMKALIDQTRAAGGKPDFQALHAARQQINQDTLTRLSGVLSPLQVKKFQALQQLRHGFGRRPGGPQPPA
jgi:Spy/CpxP family protein refolding chaperone